MADCQAIGARKAWSDAEDTQLRTLYATHSAEECAALIGRSISSIRQRVTALGITKPAGWAAARARQKWQEGCHEGSRQGHFASGHVTWNKGKPGSTGQHPNSKRHHFRKGRPANEARNYRPVGTLRVTRDGLLEKKVSDDPAVYPAKRWVAVTRLVWEAAKGPVPAGHAVVFRAGAATTVESEITLDRIELVSRGELMRRNSYHTRYPKEVAQLIQLKGALNRKINRRIKANEEPNE